MDAYDRQMLATLLHELAQEIHYPVQSPSAIRRRIQRVAYMLEGLCYDCGMVHVSAGRYLCDNCLDVGLSGLREEETNK